MVWLPPAASGACCFAGMQGGILKLSHTSPIQDNNLGYLIDRATIGYRAYLIWNSCCSNSQWEWDHYAMAGQEFEDSNTNIVVGYADCNQPDDEMPNVYAYPGVNGYCDN